MFVTAVPDIRIEVVNCVRGGEFIAVQWRATGTHTGDLPGWPASGQSVELSGLSLMRTSGNLVVEAWDSYDHAG